MASYYMDPSFGEEGRKFIDMVSKIPSLADICELAALILHRLLGHNGLLYDAVELFKPQEFVLAIPGPISGGSAVASAVDPAVASAVSSHSPSEPPGGSSSTSGSLLCVGSPTPALIAHRPYGGKQPRSKRGVGVAAMMT
jgi:hypothetical protein